MKSHNKKTTRGVRGTRKSRNEGSTKKAYRTPQLLVYGDIREITQNVGATATLDGGAGMLMIKT